MAVIPDIPGIEVEVLVDGKKLDEYSDEEQDVMPYKVVKYVTATSGAHFTLKWGFTTAFQTEHDLLVRVLLDGQKMNSRIYTNDQLVGGITHIRGGKYCHNGQWFLQKFWFSRIATNDETSGSVDPTLHKLIKATGKITVEMYHITNIRNINPSPRDHYPAADFGTVPEKALKGSEALSHHVCLDGPVPTSAINIQNFDYIGEVKLPFGTYIFKYRSLASLKALHIVPPTPPLDDRPIEGLSHKDLKQLQEQLRIYKKRVEVTSEIKSAIKKEVKTKTQRDPIGVDEDDDEPSVVSSKKRKQRHTPQENDEVIELD